MPKMKGGKAVVEALVASGAEVAFGIPGVHTLEIYDALNDTPQLRHYMARHEQGAGFMADGYARSTGRVGVALTITGPGVTNAATPLGEALADGSPVFLISSEVERAHMGKPVGTLHQLPDQLGLTQRLTKWNACAFQPEDIPHLVAEGFQQALSGRPGPVHLQIPLDILAQEAEVEIAPGSLPLPRELPLDEIGKAIHLLKKAQRPLIYAGSGVIWAGATDELVALSEALSASVLTTALGKGAFPAGHPLFLGSTWRGAEVIEGYLKNCDLVLALGTRLSFRETADGTMPLPTNLIQIDADPEVVGRTNPVQVGIAGDLRRVLSQILEGLGGHKSGSRIEEIGRIRGQVEEEAARQNPKLSGLMAELRQVLPREAILSVDPTRAGYWMARHFPVYQPRTFLHPQYFLTLGFAFPAALGAKVAHPDRPVVAIHGDGGFLFTCQELATAMLYRLGVPILVFNDASFGVVKLRQVERFAGRTIAVDLHNPDFVRLAESFGAEGVRVGALGEIMRHLEEALKKPIPTVIEIPWKLVED